MKKNLIEWLALAFVVLFIAFMLLFFFMPSNLWMILVSVACMCISLVLADNV